MKKPEVEGEVTHIEDHGTLVLMWVKLKNKKRPLVVINFDHRQFHNMYKAENGVIEGRKVKVVGELGDQTVEFLD